MLEALPVSQLLDGIVAVKIQGFGFLPSAQPVAEDYRRHCNFADEAILFIIACNTAYPTRTGFMTGLNGVAALPFANLSSFKK
ncbi:MAG: hypothetical protein ACFB4I_12925 [Cyanophyceae cyanobacterium]